MIKKQVPKRLLQIVIVLIGISFLSFMLLYMSPGDPVRAMYAVTGNIPTEEVLDEVREEMGLNEPLLVQYGTWLLNCLKGDFGTSYSKGLPVSELLAERVMPTINLALLSLVMMLLIAVPFGIISALYQNRFVDYIVRGGTFLGISMPNFWVGLLLLYLVSVKLGLLNVVSTEMDFKKMILPAFTLAFAMSGKYARQVRTGGAEAGLRVRG